MIKKLFQKFWRFVRGKHCPDMDLESLIQLREVLVEEIALRAAQHKEVKSLRRLAVLVTAKIMELQHGC